jgi:hypothetical protein
LPGEYKKTLLVALILMALVAVFFWPLISGAKVLYFRDVPRFFYPMRFYAAQRIKALETPLWNPYIFCGTPFLANWHSACFYPLSAIYYILPFERGFHIYMVVHFILAGLFMWLFLRALGLAPPSSFIGAAAFAFSGFLISLADFPNFLSSYIWLPLAFWFFHQALAKRSPGFALLTGTVLALMILAGGPEPVFVGAFLLAAFALYLCLERTFHKGPWRENLRPLFYLAMAVLLGLALSAITLIPFLEFLRHSDRAGGLGVEDSARWSANPLMLLRYIIPNFWGIADRGGVAWGGQYWLKSAYQGILPLFLALLAICYCRKKEVVFFAIAAIFFIFLALGRLTPLWGLAFRHIPGFSAMRYPVKFLMVPALAVAILAGYGADLLWDLPLQSERKKRTLKRSFLVIGVLLLLVAFVGIFFHRDLTSSLFTKYQNSPITFSKEEIGKGYQNTLESIARTAIIFLLAACAFFYGAKKKTRLPSFKGLIIGIILFDLLTHLGGAFSASIFTPGKGFLHTAPPATYRLAPQQLQNMARQERPYRIYLEPALKARLSIAIMPLPDELALVFEKEALTDDFGMLYGVEKVGGFEAMRVRRASGVLRYLVWEPKMPRASRDKFLNFLNVRYNVTARGDSILAELQERKEALERAFLVPAYLRLEKEEIWQHIMSGDWSPADIVLLEETPLEAHPPWPGRQEAAGMERAVKWLRRAAEEEILEVSTPEAAFLVISETYFPGWKAEIDGDPTKIYCANYAFRALTIPAGSHKVRIFYEPFSFKLGAWVSIATVLNSSILVLNI